MMIFCFPKMSFCWNCKSRNLLLYTVYHQLCLVLYAIMYNYIVLAYYIFILLTWFMLRIDNIEIINLLSWFYFLSHNNVKVNLYSYLEGSFFSNLGNWLTPYTLTYALEICLRWLWLMKWPLKSRWCYCWCWSWCLGFMFFPHGFIHCLSSLTFAHLFKFSTVCTWTQGLYYNEMGKS